MILFIAMWASDTSALIQYFSAKSVEILLAKITERIVSLVVERFAPTTSHPRESF